MMRLDSLAPTKKQRKRVGRGGSRGGTSGKGHKGQRARSGGRVKAGFEGGQMPLSRRLPKRGFNNARFSDRYTVLNISLLEKYFDDGQEVTLELFAKRGVTKNVRSTIKILGNGSLSKKLIVHTHALSKKAHNAIVQSGGEVRLVKGA